MRPFVFLSRSGCLLPCLIFFNLFFGWLFLKPAHWLILEFLLIALFALNGYLLARGIVKAAGSAKARGSVEVIDVEGMVEGPERD